MLTFEQKIAIIETYPELVRKSVSLGRLNFHYEESAHDKKIVVYHLHPNGNGFVYAGQAKGWDAEKDDRGMVNIREYDEAALHAILAASIDSLRPAQPTAETVKAADASLRPHLNEESVDTEQWVNAKHQRVKVIYDNDMWMIFAGSQLGQLEDAFETYEEAVDYLHEEGFNRI